MKLGSLFDGSGGFPLAGALCGIEPVWASEIEAFPIRVTTARFPGMKHLGSVTDVRGDQVEPVDIITFGSPCQDLSVAGKQKGIHDGERSNLFFEAIRIIKEMRDATADKFPRFAVWENVPGAFSSNKGEDFRAAIQSFCDIWGGGDHIVPQPPKGKWKPSGCVVGDGCSLAWRVYDAQFWGVPQRRKRIYLIADFGSERAGEILFERESLPGDSESSGEAGQETPCDAKGSAGRGYCLNQIVCFDVFNMAETKMAKTLNSASSDSDRVPCICYGVDQQGGKGTCGYAENVSPTICSDSHGTPHAVVYDARGNGEGSVCPTITGDHENRVTDYTALAVSIGNGQLHQMSMEPVARPLDCMHDQQAVIALGKPPRKYIVRRLTPTECARLQGFPDWWCDGANGSDTAQYKLWGNGVALPCVYDVMRRAAKALEDEK